MGGRPTPTRILGRGEYTNPGDQVLPGVPAVLNGELMPYRVEKSSNGAPKPPGGVWPWPEWLTQPNHPLTARVMVNRIWQHHFGLGLVSTPGNFGSTGARPSHPELLDWLARRIRGWRLEPQGPAPPDRNLHGLPADLQRRTSLPGERSRQSPCVPFSP